MDQDSAILPGVLRSDFEQWVTNAAPFEPSVNGLWFTIIQQHFDAELRSLKYSLNPELKVKSAEKAGTKGGISDLVLVKNVFRSQTGAVTVKGIWQIIIEGKKKKGDNFENTLKQLVNYARGKVDGHKGWCYLVAAIGDECKFWRYEKWDLYPVQPMDVQNDEVYINDKIAQVPFYPQKMLAYNLKNTQDQKDIVKILEYMRQHGPE
ncbi:hypothetical protein H0H92_010341 [Tricholoma furcatifolium]|nr:hypothetical protein H0H92_010341 [Tricholoma furcatifolium]